MKFIFILLVIFITSCSNCDKNSIKDNIIKNDIDDTFIKNDIDTVSNVSYFTICFGLWSFQNNN